MMKRLLFVLVIGIIGSVCLAGTQVDIKTNLLYDATLSPNLGVEINVGPKWSLELSGNLNAWKLSDTKMWKHWFVQPEARYWLKQIYRGHFFAVNAIGGQYNVIRKSARYQGWAAGAGVGYGYNVRLNRHWGIEAELTVGYARYSYDKYPCTTCGRKIASRDRNYFGPTKAAINLVYYFGKDSKPMVSAPVPQPEIIEVIVKEAVDTIPAMNFELVDVPHTRVLSQDLTGVARVRFKVNNTDINPELDRNVEELNGIISKLDSIENDLGMTVTGVKFTGYASPDGSYNNNVRLAEGRTEALRKYITGAANLPDSVTDTGFVPEDWKGLRSAVEASTLADKDALIKIIDGDLAADKKEAALAQHKESWRYILDNIMPSLRRTEYAINYEHRYEEQETMTLEQVNKAITDGDIVRAARLLVDLPSSPEADYARGVVAAKRGDYDEAKAWFSRAKARGIKAAGDAIRELSRALGQ